MLQGHLGGYTAPGSHAMFDALLLLVMLGILLSLGSALVFLVRDSGKTQRTVVSLTVRVALSVLLLALLAIGFATRYVIPAP